MGERIAERVSVPDVQLQPHKSVESELQYGDRKEKNVNCARCLNDTDRVIPHSNLQQTRRENFYQIAGGRGGISSPKAETGSSKKGCKTGHLYVIGLHL